MSGPLLGKGHMMLQRRRMMRLSPTCAVECPFLGLPEAEQETLVRAELTRMNREAAPFGVEVRQLLRTTQLRPAMGSSHYVF